MVETVTARAERVGVKVGVPVGSKNREDPVYHLLRELWYDRGPWGLFTRCGGYAIERPPPANARWCRSCQRQLAELEKATA